jgi:hypothetical protein
MNHAKFQFESAVKEIKEFGIDLEEIKSLASHGSLYGDEARDACSQISGIISKVFKDIENSDDDDVVDPLKVGM